MLETKVLPYHDDLRLLVVHVKSKKPRNSVFELDKEKGDSFELHIRRIAMNANAGAVIGENDGNLVKKIDLMESIEGGKYEFLPGAEMDDMRSIVLPVNTIIELIAEMNIHNGTTDAQGMPDTDFISAPSIIRIEP